MKIALVYDRINKWGGAERVLLALHEIWPDSPLYTAVYDPERAPWARVFRVIPSFLNKLPLAKSRHEIYPWLTPLAFESFDFSGFDIVISVTSAEAKGIITKPKTLHFCYCLTPTRYLWSGYKDYFSSTASQLVSWPAIAYLKFWDKIAAQRPDVYLATCKNVQKRIKKYYQRESEVIYPPVEVNKFKIKNEKLKITTKNEKFFLVVSRLVSYKRVDIVIHAFNKLGLPLKIIGTGSQMRRLRKMARKNIEFLGQLTDSEVLGYYLGCLAVIFPQEEDFGLVPLEAQSCGKPVIAFKGGGAIETVIDPANSDVRRNAGQEATGVFFYPQTAEALIKTILRYQVPIKSRILGGAGNFKILREKFKPENCRENAEKFGKERFKKEFKKKIEEEWQKFQRKS